MMDDDKPAYVALSFEEYERLSSGQEQIPFPGKNKFLAGAANEENILEEVNQEIFNLQEPCEDEAENSILEEPEAIPMGPMTDSQEIKIEDIPLL